MNTQHTPGPWDYEDGLTISDKSGFHIALVNQYASSFGDDQHKANARLIAAAPDMLHALQYQLDLMQWIETADTESPFYEQTMTLRLNTGRDYMELAIAKATGKETA